MTYSCFFFIILINPWVLIFFHFYFLDENEEMTDLGKLLVELPIDPQFGKMVIIGMTLKCLEPSIVIACCSAYKEPCMYSKN